MTTEVISMLDALGIDIDRDYPIPGAVWDRVVGAWMDVLAKETR
jgi:hypothetical protein